MAMSRRLTRKELVERYHRGERDFAGVDFSGTDLRGLTLNNADFRDATFRGARFGPFRHVQVIRLCLEMASGLLSVIVVFGTAVAMSEFLQPAGIDDAMFGFVLVVANLVANILVYFRGFNNVGVAFIGSG